jgi:hypothetical protein
MEAVTESVADHSSGPCDANECIRRAHVDDVAADPRIDALRERIVCVEDSSLYSHAIGYDYLAEKPAMTRHGQKTMQYRAHIPPDTAAAVWYLKNRRPDRWRDAHRHEHVASPYDGIESAAELRALLIKQAQGLGLIAPPIIDVTPKQPSSAPTESSSEALKTPACVLGGMDGEFREQLYHAGRAMDAAGLQWSMLSAFRDDYRQSLASGYKASTSNSLHGGSRRTVQASHFSWPALHCRQRGTKVFVSAGK